MAIKQQWQIPDRRGITPGDKLGSLYRFDVDSTGKFSGEIVSFQANHLFGYALGLSDGFGVSSTPDQNRTYLFRRENGGYLGDHWLSPPGILPLHPFFGSSIAVNDDWLVIAARDEGSGLSGRVFLYPGAGRDWSRFPRTLKSANEHGLFGSQIQLRDNRLLISSAPWLDTQAGATEGEWNQDIYIYDLDSSGKQWLLVNQPISLAVAAGNHTASAVLLGELVVISGYDRSSKRNALKVYQNLNGQWQLLQSVEAATGAVDYGYNLQVADNQLLVSQHGPQAQVRVLQLDNNQLMDTGTVITYPDQDNKPGFADLMAYDGRFLYLSRKGVTGQVNNYPGKIFVYTRKANSEVLNEFFPDLRGYVNKNRL